MRESLTTLPLGGAHPDLARVRRLYESAFPTNERRPFEALLSGFDGQGELLALYHEAPEVITGDLATPIKYFNPGIRSAYKEIEGLAAKKLHAMLPEDLQGDYAPLLLRPEEDPEWKRVKAADKISAYVKCVEELRAGNDEFTRAGESILSQIEAMDLPEARAFLAEFLPSFRLTMDELN